MAFTQTQFRGRNDDGTETTATWKAALNTNWSQAPGVNFRVRFEVQSSTKLTTGQAWQLFYNKNGAGWNPVTATSSVVKSPGAAMTNITDTTATTQQLRSGSYNAGTCSKDDGFFGATTFSAAGTYTELEAGCQIVSTDVVGGDTIQLRMAQDNFTAFATYTQLPTITVAVSTTPVSNTQPVSWNVASAVSSSQAITWNVLSSVSRTQAVTWNVAQVVTASQQVTWNVAGNAPVSSLTEDWSSGSISSTTWPNSYGGQSVVSLGGSNVLRLAPTGAGTAYAEVGTGSNVNPGSIQYSLVNSFVYCQIPAAFTSDGTNGAQQFQFNDAVDGSGTGVFFEITGGQITAYNRIAYADQDTPAGMAYSAATHRWLKILHNGTNVLMQYSSDASAWNTLATFTVKPWMSSGQVTHTANVDNATTSAFYFDNLNTTPGLTQVSATRQVTWNVTSAVTKTQAVSWNVASVTSSSQQVAWNVARTVSSSQQVTWNVAGAAVDPRPETFESYPIGSWTQGSTHGLWYVQFVSTGATNPQILSTTGKSGTTTQALQIESAVPSGTNTSATLVTSPTGRSGDLDFSVDMRTLQQMRASSPNAWEVAWIGWNFTQGSGYYNVGAGIQGPGTYNRFYYVVLKSTGFELGKVDQGVFLNYGGQRFLWTDSTPIDFTQWHTVRVNQTGARIRVWVDGTLRADFTDGAGSGGTPAWGATEDARAATETVLTSGGFALYEEDARAQFDNLLDTSGTTSVSNSQATSWNVASAVSAAQPVTWNVLSSVSKASSVTWNVAGAVAATQPVTWNVATVVGTSQPVAWNVLSSVANSQATSWVVNAQVAATRQVTWNVLSNQTMRAMPSILYGWTTDATTQSTGSSTTNTRISDALDAIQARMGVPGIVRTVFDYGTGAPTAAQYATDITAIQPHGYVMGQILDSTDLAKITVADMTQRATDYVNAMGSLVDLWEIGNEVNGNWTIPAGGTYQDVVDRIYACWSVVHSAGKRTALTLWYNYLAGDGPSEYSPEQFTALLPADMRNGLDYVLISWYETEATPNRRPPESEFQSFFDGISASYPNAKLGFGEIGLPNATTSTTLSTAESIMTYYMALQVTTPGYIGGYFWWYGRQDFLPINSAAGTVKGDMWSTFLTSLDSEKAALTTATTASVSATQPVTWNVRSTVARTQVTSWNVTSTVARTQAVTWNVAGTVSRTQAVTWNVAGTSASVTASLPVRWNVAYLVARVLGVTWNVRSSVTRTQATSWNVRAPVLATRLVSWTINGRVAASLTVSWYMVPPRDITILSLSEPTVAWITTEVSNNWETTDPTTAYAADAPATTYLTEEATIRSYSTTDPTTGATTTEPAVAWQTTEATL